MREIYTCPLVRPGSDDAAMPPSQSVLSLAARRRELKGATSYSKPRRWAKNALQYEDSDRLWFDEHNHPADPEKVDLRDERYQQHRCYKLVSPIHMNRQLDFFFVVVARVVSGRRHARLRVRSGSAPSLI